MTLTDRIKVIIQDILPDLSVHNINENTALLGAVAEFDSMTIVQLLEALEESFNIEINDDEISSELFETIGTLSSYIASKIAESSTDEAILH